MPSRTSRSVGAGFSSMSDTAGHHHARRAVPALEARGAPGRRPAPGASVPSASAQALDRGDLGAVGLPPPAPCSSSPTDRRRAPCTRRTTTCRTPRWWPVSPSAFAQVVHEQRPRLDVIGDGVPFTRRLISNVAPLRSRARPMWGDRRNRVSLSRPNPKPDAWRPLGHATKPNHRNLTAHEAYRPMSGEIFVRGQGVAGVRDFSSWSKGQPSGSWTGFLGRREHLVGLLARPSRAGNSSRAMALDLLVGLELIDAGLLLVVLAGEVVDLLLGEGDLLLSLEVRAGGHHAGAPG